MLGDHSTVGRTGRFFSSRDVKGSVIEQRQESGMVGGANEANVGDRKKTLEARLQSSG